MSRNNIKVVGVGGGGSNTIDYIVTTSTTDITTYAVNTDAQALANSKADKQIHIGKASTKGLGAGALPAVGRAAAEESSQELIRELEGAEIVFVSAGMGGGTGTGAAPYVAAIAKQLGILTIGVVTKPFRFEGPSRMKMALEGIKQLENNSDVTIVIPNEKLIQNFPDLLMEEAFSRPDNVLKTAIEAIVKVLESYSAFTSNIDLNTLRSLLTDKGLAVMGIGSSANEELSPQENIMAATEAAVNSDILEVSINGAQEFVIMLTANVDMMQYEDFEYAPAYLGHLLGYQATIVPTIDHDPSMKPHEFSVTIIATGYQDQEFVEQITQEEEKSRFQGINLVEL